MSRELSCMRKDLFVWEEIYLYEKRSNECTQPNWVGIRKRWRDKSSRWEETLLIWDENVYISAEIKRRHSTKFSTHRSRWRDRSSLWKETVLLYEKRRYLYETRMYLYHKRSNEGTQPNSVRIGATEGHHRTWHEYTRLRFVSYK